MAGATSHRGACCGCGGSDDAAYEWIKIFLIVYNFGFLLLSLGFIGLGIYSEIWRSEITEAEHFLLTPSVFLFVLGFIGFLFAGFGCVGALRDNLCVLKFFICSVLLCVLIELGAGIAALIFKDPAKNFVNDYVMKCLPTYYDDPDLKNVIDFVQEDFYCCGGRNYHDWEINPYHNCSAPGPAACGVPFSCCKPQPDDDLIVNSMCGYDTLHKDQSPFDVVNIIYVDGCIDAVIDYLWLHMDVFAAILLGVFIPQVTGIILGTMYVYLIKKIVARQRTNEEENFM
uniref:tetraspanin-15-like isoform X1 n=1 Tax=Ciona intestinalis TaxID=7719 RepID=UPI00089DB7F1|nr:tetraspanin-15-like isoform X1 [Ciona intestinalis]|eukprot:XP_018670164.1 tetraspanin-15-like isoform X1 [Ciona intestinalis]